MLTMLCVLYILLNIPVLISKMLQKMVT